MQVMSSLAGNRDTIPHRRRGFIVTPERILFITIGFISLVLGIIGIFLPLLPTVPFILLSAACFSRGSVRMHSWLVRMPFAGKVIDDYEKGRGVSRKSKATALVMLWGGMTISAVAMKLAPWVMVVLALVAIGASIVIVRLPKRQDDKT